MSPRLGERRKALGFAVGRGSRGRNQGGIYDDTRYRKLFQPLPCTVWDWNFILSENSSDVTVISLYIELKIVLQVQEARAQVFRHTESV